jgi:shikimate kinase
MSRAENMVLIGLMGAGKTSVGKHLAQHLGWKFLDTDHVLEERCGANIPWIFDIEGEAGFRRRETEVLEDLCQYKNTVIATGGGIVLSEHNRSLLKTCGTVVYLAATPGQLYARVAHDTHRPLLQVENPEAVLAKLLVEREPLYKEVADLVIPSEGSRSAKYMADRVADKLGKLG